MTPTWSTGAGGPDRCARGDRRRWTPGDPLGRRPAQYGRAPGPGRADPGRGGRASGAGGRGSGVRRRGVACVASGAALEVLRQWGAWHDGSWDQAEGARSQPVIRYMWSVFRLRTASRRPCGRRRKSKRCSTSSRPGRRHRGTYDVAGLRQRRPASGGAATAEDLRRPGRFRRTASVERSIGDGTARPAGSTRPHAGVPRGGEGPGLRLPSCAPRLGSCPTERRALAEHVWRAAIRRRAHGLLVRARRLRGARLRATSCTGSST